MHGERAANNGGPERISRRAFVAAGAAGFGGLSLPNLLRAEQAAGIAGSNRSVIFVHLDGGAPQLDTFDPKPDAPEEIRGEFRSVATRLPGVHVSEHLPLLADRADRLAIVRSLVGSDGRHDAFQCQSGWPAKDLASSGGRPVLGCVVGKLQGKPGDAAPPFVDLMQGRALVRNSARPGFLGPSHAPFRPDVSALFDRPLEDKMKDELARLGGEHSIRLTLSEGLTLDRIQDRTTLLAGLDRVRRDIDASGMMDAADRFTQQAVGILTSGRLAEALDLQAVDPDTLARYTTTEPDDVFVHPTSEGPQSVRKFLLALRLVQAGVRCVSLSFGDFDTHSNNFPRLRRALPILDRGLSALLDDLERLGLLDDVTVVVWGEFGRTPRVDAKTGGRHHWPQVGSALLAGGGLRAGTVLGSTDRWGAEPASRPVHYQDVIATVYRNLGIDPRTTVLTDPSGRPQHLLDHGQPLAELA